MGSRYTLEILGEKERSVIRLCRCVSAYAEGDCDLLELDVRIAGTAYDLWICG